MFASAGRNGALPTGVLDDCQARGLLLELGDGCWGPRSRRERDRAEPVPGMLLPEDALLEEVGLWDGNLAEVPAGEPEA